MFRSLIAALFLAMLVVVGTGSSNVIRAEDGTKDKPAKEEKVKPRDYDGVSLATCDHPIDREVRKSFRELTRKDDGSKVRVPVIEEVESNITCPSSQPTTSDPNTMVTMALVSPMNWRCYHRVKSTSLGLLEYQMAISQYFSTTAYTNIVWPPPPVEAVNIKADHGWKADGSWTAWGPNAIAYFSPGIVSKGKSAVTQRFSANFFWYNAETRDARIEVDFKYNSCYFRWSGF